MQKSQNLVLLRIDKKVGSNNGIWKIALACCCTINNSYYLFFIG